MRIAGIVHQQICQLRWHILACLGLIMVLPVEEALVNLRAGGGFYSAQMVAAAVTFGPLLAGLLACAIVQGDLDEKRYIFWRSKPANVKLFMALKFVIGLIAFFAVLACPIVFAIVTIVLFAREHIERELMFSAPFFVLIAIMTYSLCFACNVLVRKTARSWLIGMLLAGFLLVIPFILPLGFRDFVTDVAMWTPISFVLTVFAASVAAFVFALYATQHDWHLRTDLKALLWVGGGLVFVLLMLLKSQVANIKVLDEKQIEPSWGSWTLDTLDSRMILQGESYIDIGKDVISLHRIAASPIHGNLGIDSAGRQIIYGPRGLREDTYPRCGRGLYRNAGNDIYYFVILAYYRTEGEGRLLKRTYEKIYLRSYKLTEESWMPVNELDISDCLTNRTDILRMAMRLVDSVIVTCVNQSCIVVDVTDPGELKRIDTKLGALEQPTYYQNRQREFALPLVPVEGIDIQEKIRLSIDLHYVFPPYGRNDIYKFSIVDIDDGRIAFFLVSDKDVARFDVVRWDQENIYCRFSTARPFTILESITGVFYRCDAFVKGGNLYCYGSGTLLVFDTRSKRGIRKLGHFVRMDYSIEDIGVLSDGDILLSMQWERNLSRSYRDKPRKSYLCLLENPS